MAQTKKKRRSKHRGTAAGSVQSRGRTGRKPTDGEKPKGKEADVAARREARLNRPPSWRSAANRAVIATVLFLVAVLVIFKQPVATAVSLAAFMLLLYIPMGYYTDAYLYKRRQLKRDRGE
ncbi:MAG: hypothetical protein ACR2NH_11185 [Solirubrobacteraceae bacterium]